MSFGERVAGTGFQVALEVLRQLQSFEGEIASQFPRRIFRGVRTFARVVVCETIL